MCINSDHPNSWGEDIVFPVLKRGNFETFGIQKKKTKKKL